jgi:uncharacterized protein
MTVEHPKKNHLALAPINVLGEPLELCCNEPKTGYFRDGFCRTDENDHGSHTVCAEVTEAFLAYSKSVGNDLTTPVPGGSFPGLKPGDRWCLCAARWKDAFEAGVAPTVYLESTHVKALEIVPLAALQKHAKTPR